MAKAYVRNYAVCQHLLLDEHIAGRFEKYYNNLDEKLNAKYLSLCQHLKLNYNNNGDPTQRLHESGFLMQNKIRTFPSVQIRKEVNGWKYCSDYEKRTIEYDTESKLWRVDHPTTFRSLNSGHHTKPFGLDSFKFRFDYRGTEQRAKLGSPVIKIFPNKKRVSNRLIRLCDPKTGCWLKPTSPTMIFVKFLIVSTGLEVCYKKRHEGREGSLNGGSMKMRPMYKELLKHLNIRTVPVRSEQ